MFYEVGWAHALNKPTILCAKSSDDLRAFDTAGYRHVLHGGKAYVMRKKLNEVVPDVLRIAPQEPSGADLVWAWPETDFEPPNLEWHADPKRTGGRTQVDIYGGQSIENQMDGSQVLVVRDTTTNWNHDPGWSILRILESSRAFSFYDEAIVSLFLRTDGDADIELIGDGTKLDENKQRVWARGLSGSRKRLSSRIWCPLLISGVVEATEDGQDPSEQGITVYLRFHSDSTIWVRQIRLYISKAQWREV